MADDAEHLHIYRNAITSLVFQAGGELTVDIEELPDNMVVLYRVEPDHDEKKLRVRFVVQPPGKPS